MPGVKRLAKGLQNLASRLENDEEFRKTIVQTPETIYMRDFSTPAMQARRQQIKTEFITVMRAILVLDNVIPKDATDDDVERHCFQVHLVVDYVTMYIHAIGGSSETNKGTVSERFKIGALQSRTATLWWFTTWILAEQSASIYVSWEMKTTAAELYVADKYNLGTESYPKEYFGMAEMWLLYETILITPQPASSLKQNYAAWTIMLITGARPGSLYLPREWANTSMFFKWRDIKFRRIPCRKGLFLEINLCVVGVDFSTTEVHQRKGVTFTIFPPTLRQNCCVDLTWILPMIALERGLFGDVTLEDLEQSELAILPQDPVVMNHPVFRAAQPDLLVPVCRLAGIPVRSSSYVFRREALTAFERNTGIETARQLATHKRPGCFDHYDYGPGDINLTEARLAQLSMGGEERNRLRMLVSSSAINKLTTPFDEKACRKYVKNALKRDNLWILFREAHQQVLQNIRDQFGVSEKFPARIAEQLYALPGVVIVTDGEWGKPGDVCDGAQWLKLSEKIENASHAIWFMDAMYMARGTHNTTRRVIYRKQFINEWAESSSAPTLSEVKSRLAAVESPGLLDQYEIETDSDIEGEEGFDVDDVDKGTGVTRGGDDIDDAGAIDELPDGTMAELLFPQEQSSSSNTSQDGGYAAARMRVISLWDGLVDFTKSKQPCPLCEAHPWALDDEVLDSAFKVDRHICAPAGAHVMDKGRYHNLMSDYGKSSEDPVTERAHCRLCALKGIDRSWSTYTDVAKHLKKEHQEFIDDLSR